MPSSYARVILHTVFSTKHRVKFIDDQIEPGLFRFIQSRIEFHKGQLIRINGTENHIHILHTLPRTITIAKLLEDIKSLSSKWMKRQGPQYTDFAWQDGYATFSVHHFLLDKTIAYVDNQKNHHSNDLNSFEMEFKALLDEHDCAYDPRYLF